MIKQKSPEQEITLIREFGLHEVDKSGDEEPTYIASFPEYEELIMALEDDLPQSGTIVTPEYITVPNDVDNIDDYEELIKLRNEEIRKLTESTDATIMLGTSRKIAGEAEDKWHNSVIEYRNGEEVSITDKHNLLKAEEDMGIEAADLKEKTRAQKDGHAVLICAELYAHIMNPEIYKNSTPNELLVPMEWATPTGRLDEESSKKIMERHGGADKYYSDMLGRAAGIAMESFPSVDRIVTADRGTKDLAPYNAIIRRK